MDRRRALPVAVAGVLLVASLVDPTTTGPPPREPLPFGLPPDKLAHGVAYAALAASLAPALRPDTLSDGSPDGLSDGSPDARRRALRVAGLAVLLATAYGAGIELLQAPLPARHADPADALANGVGAVAGAAGWFARVARQRAARRRG